MSSSHTSVRLRLKRDGTCAETRFRLSAKRTSLFKSAGAQFSWLLAAEVCASAVVMLDTPCSEVVWRVLATYSIRQFSFHFPSSASPCAITLQLKSTHGDYRIAITDPAGSCEHTWGSPSCRGWGPPSCIVWSQPRPAYSHNSHTLGNPRARRGPAPLGGTCNTSQMSAEHSGAESSQMGTQKLRFRWHWIVGISRQTAGQEQWTITVS